MIQLNLLPWRQYARKVKKLRFAFGGIVAFIFALLILLILHHNASRVLNNQEARNDFIKSEINQEQAALTKLKNELGERSNYALKIRSLINIRKANYNAIRFLNVLPTLNMPSIFIMNIARSGNQIAITGKAQTNEQITAFMNNIASLSTVFDKPDLTSVKNEKGANTDAGYFELKIIEKDFV